MIIEFSWRSTDTPGRLIEIISEEYQILSYKKAVHLNQDFRRHAAQSKKVQEYF